MFSVNKLDVKAREHEYSFELKGLQVFYRVGLEYDKLKINVVNGDSYMNNRIQ